MTACAGCGTPSYSAARNCASCPAFSEWPIDPDAPAERKPSADWVKEGDSLWLRVGAYTAQVEIDQQWTLWLSPPVGQWTSVASGWHRGEAAQLAAEDALLAIAAEIVGAVRR